MAGRKELEQRWDPARTAEAFRRLVAREELDSVAFGTVDGRLDLRGMVADTEDLRGRRAEQGWYPPFELVAVPDARLEHLDLRGARLPALELEGCTLVDILFDGADLTSLRLSGSVRTCSFSGTSLYGCVLAIRGPKTGVLRRRRTVPTTFEGCDFTRADIRHGSSGDGTTFLRCVFDRAKYTASWWISATDYRQCRFAGRLSSPEFNAAPLGHPGDADPSRLDGSDFSAAEVLWPTIRGLDCAGVTWPEDDKHIVVHSRYVEVLLAVKARLVGSDEPGASEVLWHVEHNLESRGPAQESGVFHVSQFSKHGGDEAVALARKVFAEAERRVTDTD